MDLPEDSEEEDCGDTAKTSVGKLPQATNSSNTNTGDGVKSPRRLKRAPSGG